MVGAGQFSYLDRLAANRSATLKGLLKEQKRQLRKVQAYTAALARQRETARGNGNLAVAKKDAA
jgi:hypothetical protein